MCSSLVGISRTVPSFPPLRIFARGGRVGSENERRVGPSIRRRPLPVPHVLVYRIYFLNKFFFDNCFLNVSGRLEAKKSIPCVTLSEEKGEILMHRGGIFFSLPLFIIFHASAPLARTAAALSKGLASSRDKNCRGDAWEIRQVGFISQSISGFYNFGTKSTLAWALQK